MRKDELTGKLIAIYWSAQTEKEQATASIQERGKQEGAFPEKVQSLIQRSIEDIEHSMRMKLAAAAVEFIHSTIE